MDLLLARWARPVAVLKVLDDAAFADCKARGGGIKRRPSTAAPAAEPYGRLLQQGVVQKGNRVRRHPTTREERGLTCMEALHERSRTDKVARAQLAHNVRVHLPQLELDLHGPRGEPSDIKKRERAAQAGPTPFVSVFTTRRQGLRRGESSVGTHVAEPVAVGGRHCCRV